MRLTDGAKEGVHSHPASIVHVIEGGKVRNHFPDGSTTVVGGSATIGWACCNRSSRSQAVAMGS